ncbi:Nicotinate-nucleotide--dimethylbenzimidazole phosphoribosyltransferase [Vibrio aerogenes CECT 7868]|uniref:Nicotinate-nucleotide--dimethylbenzimidazole phosphoribosyltransferase n=1 Tax=Vibrio aerogenes CECT 7868 TaxID=1216006 RepID=A0A1M5ZVB3_9VIBR|nr:nicotinate-nucleotide--dimethylbenzimidazole phosphoribosyltransferase [Vibrio aerogenes]SHI27873.1 Nicotinate-nucleotide--dimethylbenzimidazole phosphoribosyltransferase [Vibrio aerogenes CECT 7868]
MLNTRYLAKIRHRIDQKTKPAGSLGALEDIAQQLALIQSQGKEDAVTQLEIHQPTVIVFAGDHGVADEGVSIAPSEVTYQMVMNFLAGGAGVNCFCRSAGVGMKVVDCGIMIPVEAPHPDCFIQQRLGSRTNNFHLEPAMTEAQVTQGIKYGQNVVTKTIEAGSNLVMFGEMGIGNTTSAAAILASLTQIDPQMCVGHGTGIQPEQFMKKTAIVRQCAEKLRGENAMTVLAGAGGFEIVQMVGAFIGAAQRGVPVIVDGFIVTVAAYVATLLEPACRDYMIFAHQSEEPGHQRVLEVLYAKPLLHLGLRLGEGTGAVLAVPLIQAACEFYNTMASFDEAGVTV